MPDYNRKPESASDIRADKWPFSTWLKIAVMRFGLSPKAFWAMSVMDWQTLIETPDMPVLGRAQFDALAKQYPDADPSAQLKDA